MLHEMPRTSVTFKISYYFKYLYTWIIFKFHHIMGSWTGSYSIYEHI